VNKSQCSYCEYHVQAEKKKLGSGRAQLRGNFLKTSLWNAKTQYSGTPLPPSQPRCGPVCPSVTQEVPVCTK